MSGGSLAGGGGGPLFRVTITRAVISLKKVAMSTDSDELVVARVNDAKDGVEVHGTSGGDVVFRADDQALEGDLVADASSSNPRRR